MEIEIRRFGEGSGRTVFHKHLPDKAVLFELEGSPGFALEFMGTTTFEAFEQAGVKLYAEVTLMLSDVWRIKQALGRCDDCIHRIPECLLEKTACAWHKQEVFLFNEGHSEDGGLVNVFMLHTNYE